MHSLHAPIPRIDYKQGDHVCTLYSTREEQLAAAIEYIRAGLSRGERCLYVCAEHTPDEFRAELREAGIDVDVEEARGALVLLTKHEGHLKGGFFFPDRMISMLRQAVEEALDAGFAGLCAAGDMSWLLDEAPARSASPSTKRASMSSTPPNAPSASASTTARSFPRRCSTTESRRIRTCA